MKERPILFSGPMVNAIREGRKTQTRRVMKPQPVLSDDAGWIWPKGPQIKPSPDANETPYGMGRAVWDSFCPYGVPGDRLWVRETWGYRSFEDAQAKRPVYKADWVGQRQESSLRWRPSIHMPRWACRLVLEVVSVRVERVQAISEEDIAAEGVSKYDGGEYLKNRGPMVSTFMRLWESINGGGSWARNDWVWVVEFKKVEAAN